MYAEKIEEENRTGIRVVLVRGNQEKIDFNVLEEAYLSYWVEITEGEEEPCTEAMSYCDDEMCRVELSVDGEKIGEAEVNLKPGTYLPKQENLEKVFKNGGFYYKEI